MTWRDHIAVHPAADLFPMMSDAELNDLAADIKANGLRQPIVLYDGQLLDGRNRLEACVRAGSDTKAILNAATASDLGRVEGFDPYAYVISANILRRHLTAAQRGDLIETVLKAAPEKSDREIARQTKASDKTVAARRSKLVSRAEIPNVERVDTKGRRVRDKRAAKAKTTPPLRPSPVDQTFIEPTSDNRSEAEPILANPIDAAWYRADDAQRTEFMEYAGLVGKSYWLEATARAVLVEQERDAATARAKTAEKELHDLLAPYNPEFE